MAAVKKASVKKRFMVFFLSLSKFAKIVPSCVKVDLLQVNLIKSINNKVDLATNI